MIKPECRNPTIIMASPPKTQWPEEAKPKTIWTGTAWREQDMMDRHPLPFDEKYAYPPAIEAGRQVRVNLSIDSDAADCWRRTSEALQNHPDFQPTVKYCIRVESQTLHMVH